MQTSTFGPTGLRVSRLFLGAMTFGGDRSVGAPADECGRILARYEEAGGNVIDTAINYRNGDSETILGELLSGRRDRFVVSTKYTVSRDRDDPNGGGNHRKNLIASLEISLRRLQTDFIDIYWVHMWDRHTPIEETMRALDDAVRAGKIRYVGISDAPAWVVSRANVLADWRAWTPFAGIQVPYSLVQRDIEHELLPMADHLGLTVAAWSPLGGGLLSGKFNDPSVSADGPTRLSRQNIADRDAAIAAELCACAEPLAASPAQTALAWVMGRSPRIHPILGARSERQLDENLAALSVDLPAEISERLDAVSRPPALFPTSFINETSPWVFGAADITGRADGA